jgi:multidrug resistance efflux pump
VFINRLFREQALARRRRQEPLDDRLQVTAPHEWLLVAGLGVMLGALLVYGVVGSVERSVSYDAVVVLPGDRYPVSAPVSGAVAEVLAEVGGTVEPGQVIARVRPHVGRPPDSEARRLSELLAARTGQDGETSADLLLLLLALAAATSAEQTDAGVDVVSVAGGEIMTLGLAPGMPVRAGEPVALVRAATPGPPEVLALVPSDDARRLEAGMEARVSVAQGNRQAGTYPAEVAAVSERAVTPPEWLEGLGVSAPEGSHLVRVALADGATAGAVADGSIGSLRVVLERSSFLSLLAPGGGS